MNSQTIRNKYLNFFKENGHSVIPSASLIPENDPTVLFTTAGMHPLVPYLMGGKHAAGSRLVNVQKCIRTGDIDEVGDPWHLTFFEMLGNWSLGDYWKKDAITWSFQFLTKELNLPIEKLAVTVFAGDADAPRDDESAKMWLGLGITKERITYLGKEDNWWPAGGKMSGPQGPDTEIFYWAGLEDAPKFYDPSDKRWVEIWNNVFMQFTKDEQNRYLPIAQKNVDTGMGLERTVAVLGKMADVYQVDSIMPIIKKIEELSGKKYLESEEITKSMRIIADHLRAATMIIGDQRGIPPSNVDQGYIVRRLIRRAIRKGRQLGIKEIFCSEISKIVVDIFGGNYPEVIKNKHFIINEMIAEEEKFGSTLMNGLKHFATASILAKHANKKHISGKEVFNLFQTFGFPFEMSIEEIKTEKVNLTENDIQDLYEDFKEELGKHQELSRAGAEQKFKGGLADTSEESTKLHTATHLLQAALRKVLGLHVEQKGSNITAKRLRFDFSHPNKMTEDEKKQVEDLVNAAIVRDYLISFREMSITEAKEKGAIGLFEDKYNTKVKVYTVGDPNQKPIADPASFTFSMEICGGPHAQHTGELGHFKIEKEEASSAGVRRIKAILEINEK